MPLRVCALNKLIQKARIDCVDTTEQVFPVRNRFGVVLLRHVPSDIFVVLYHIPNFLNGELVDSLHGEIFELVLFENSLLVSEQGLPKVLAGVGLRRQLILTLKNKKVNVRFWVAYLLVHIDVQIMTGLVPVGHFVYAKMRETSFFRVFLQMIHQI